MEVDRQCLECGEPVSPHKRSDAVYCCKKCRDASDIRANQAERNRRWRAKNPDWKERCSKPTPKQMLKYRLWHTYRLTPEDFDQMMADQGGSCAICGAPPAKGKRLHVDHDHETGQIRALLCFHCNCGLGHYQDRPDLLRKAADYLDYGG